ncbi:MAG: response regulator transcription factor, partial [Cyanobacteria bacterium J06633_8]
MEELSCYYHQQEYCQSRRQKNGGRGQKDKVEKGSTSNNQKVMQGKSVPFVELPLQPPTNWHLPSSQLDNSPLIYANSNFQDIDKIRAVVVEDQELIVIGIKKALEQYENIEIVGDAFNAKHGLTLLNNLKPKIAIVDICLPDCDGIQLTREIKRKHSGVKVIILTSHSDR